MNSEHCAYLGMYDWPETQAAIDSLWQQLKSTLRDAGLKIDETLTLDRERAPMDIWLDPGLIIGQTCGFPYIQHLQDKTSLMGTPKYTAPGCRDGHYVSWILARKDDSRSSLLDFVDSPVAINGLDSQSGCNALRLTLSDLAHDSEAENEPFIQAVQSGFFSRVVLSGAHRQSLKAVAEQRADVCAIDPVCLALAKQHDADIVSQLKIIGTSPETPSLPLITSNTTAGLINLVELQLALKNVMSNLPQSLQQALHLDGLVLLADSQYQEIGRLTQRANQMGISSLASD